ncbi:MAG: hypothetical protein DRH12_10485 [Deltaproteobacteria bacterium]|nr:MAG: hypothetical protein DRH12_10485 [Deltaproteobacteria bacterium]RLB80957.1 MAG: hypothetical protein DRH15_07095 [Deltaproteobacteria bacterium]
MEKVMEKWMIRKLDSVLDRVKEPESNLTVGQLGLVKKFRYNETKRALYVYIDTYATHKACCLVITKLIETRVMEDLRKELEKEFPDLAIRFV